MGEGGVELRLGQDGSKSNRQGLFTKRRSAASRRLIRSFGPRGSIGENRDDVAKLKGEDVDWTQGTISLTRQKTHAPVIVHLGRDAMDLFKDLPSEGPLFLYLSQVWAGDRATEFG